MAALKSGVTCDDVISLAQTPVGAGPLSSSNGYLPVHTIHIVMYTMYVLSLLALSLNNCYYFLKNKDLRKNLIKIITCLQ